MKIVKLTKKMLRMEPDRLLLKIGTVSASSVYVSKEDYFLIKKNLDKIVKRLHPGFSKRYRDFMVGMALLNYGPNETLSSAIKPGYALVDYDAIEKKSHAKQS